MIKHTRLWIVIILVAVSVSNNAFAQPNTPLMIIRFNSEHVLYENSLRRSVDSARRIKPTTFFDIVGVIAGEENSYRSRKAEALSKTQATDIVNNLRKYGVKSDRIRVSYQFNNNVAFNEFHLFVR